MTASPARSSSPPHRATAWSVAAVRAAEARLLARTPEGSLMARAAHGLAHHCAVLLAEHDRQVYGARIAIMAGRGSNGGDALHAGAALARRGAAVTAILAAASRSQVHQGGLTAVLAAGGSVICVGDGSGETASFPALEEASLVLDGLVGIGGRGALRSPMIDLVRAANRARERGSLLVAVDLPSGVDADTGEVAGPSSDVVCADLTVTFGCLKPGLLLAPGAHHAGRVELVDIGLAPALARNEGENAPVLRATSDADMAALWPRAGQDTDKYQRGVLGLAAGSLSYPGAALLAAGGALAGPIGMLRCVGEPAGQVIERYPEAVPGSGVASVGRVQAWVVGPGLGTDERAAQTLLAVLEAGLPTVIDGDAITLLAHLLANPATRDTPSFPSPVVLTPHHREFARLASACGVRIDGPGGPLAAAQLVAEHVGATVLLKGSRTLVVTPGRLSRVNLTGSSVLATAGSGDVLAGLLGSLLAAGRDAHEASAAAAHLHGLAGRRAALTGTVTASTLVRELPAVVAAVTRVL